METPPVHKLLVPTPFAVGPTNCWLIEGKPLTLVDTGPKTKDALAGLESGLAALGHTIEDLERVVITHGHIDHFGLTASVRKRSGAEVLCHADEQRMVEKFTIHHRAMF